MTKPATDQLLADLPPSYRPAEEEPAILERWLQGDAYQANASDAGDAYSICIPPPNVTAPLHLGHALNNTIQDILTRHARMSGRNAVWLPGTDHAGIATQTVVEKRVLAEEGKRRTDFERDEFIGKIQAWKDEYEAKITDQLKQMGCSCDWSRQAFTMDEPRARAVREAFFQLFKDGLIYRGKRLVNWDPVTQTALADDEVEMKDVDANFYYLKYPVCDADGNLSGDHVTVATTRPETMLGDTAVAVNPKDEPRAKYIGQYVKLPICDRVIPILGDEYVVIPDPDSDDAKARMASGFLKVTPAHDTNDYEIGQRHDLEIINVMAPDASISIDHGWPEKENPKAIEALQPFLGLPREAARKAVVRWFKEQDLLAEVKPYRHAVGHSYRSHAAIEPYYSDQWYLKVTDDKLAGAALRAMHPTQRTDTQPSRDREGAPPATPLAYLITFTTYGTWLHGNDKGSVDRDHNLPGTPFILGDPSEEDPRGQRLTQEPLTLNQSERQAVQEAIAEVCDYRGWSLHALHVRTNHLHAVVGADAKPEKVMNDFKSYATRRLRHDDLVEDNRKVWTRHGSTRYLWEEQQVAAAIQYTRDRQGKPLEPGPIVGTGVNDSAEVPGGEALPHGRGSVTPEATGLTFTPPRYAKTFQTWHENIRDWCISRQLWWGHRIPVWHIEFNSITTHDPSQVEQWIIAYFSAIGLVDEICLIRQRSDGFLCCKTTEAQRALEELERVTRTVLVRSTPRGAPHDESYDRKLHPDFAQAQNFADSLHYTLSIKQDPDVLDTWFSSALWPMSTLGWPERTPELDLWNPTSVLCTAREIITLWVSRMVMFNLYFLGRLPFRDVFIHAMIQDGHGQKMSKSLGNGVDPMDIIHSHGADAMRFTLASMTTQTQDVRMPVDMVAPGSGETFTPKFITASGGVKVAAPTQEYKGEKMVSSYGIASGEVKPSDEQPLARNTSEKFELGQRFATKLWNATRFALSNLAEVDANRAATVRERSGRGGEHQSEQALPHGRGSVADRWILSRTVRAIEHADKTLSAYDFHNYAGGLYEFVWNEVCDWYIEAVKPVIKTPEGAKSRQVLATVLDVSLRLLHPVMPFVTERLWSGLNAVFPQRGVAGLDPDECEELVSGNWPTADRALIDLDAEEVFPRVQHVVGMIREVRAGAKVPPREVVEFSLQMEDAEAERVRPNLHLVETLTNIKMVAVGPDIAKPDGAAVVTGPAGIGYLHVEIDTAEEAERLSKRKAELERSLKTLDGRLSNEKYTSKAPSHLVQQTRDQRAAAAAELDEVERQLAGL